MQPMREAMALLEDMPDAEEFAALLAREEMRRARTGEHLAVAVLDIDGLQAINENHGESAATEVLDLCAIMLRETVRGVDEVARTGPDDFSVLLHGTDAKAVTAWSDRFEDALLETTSDHPAGPVTCAIGLADTADEPSLMGAASRARKRMEVVQTVRRLRRARETGN